MRETILTAIEDIELAQLYSEYEVLTALGESYAKSVMMVQEAYVPAERTAYVSGKKVEDKKKWYQALWEFIKKIAGKIKDFFLALPGKIRDFFKSLPGKIKKAGQTIKEIPKNLESTVRGGGAKLKYVGTKAEPWDNENAVDELTNPANYEITIGLDPDTALAIIEGINKTYNQGGAKLEDLLYAIKGFKSQFKSAFNTKTMSLEEFLQKVEPMSAACATLQKVCDTAKKENFESENEKVQNYMEKQFPEVVKALNELSAFMTKLVAQAAIPAELQQKFMDKIFVSKVSKAMASTIKKQGKGEKQPEGAEPGDLAAAGA